MFPYPYPGYVLSDYSPSALAKPKIVSVPLPGVCPLGRDSVFGYRYNGFVSVPLPGVCPLGHGQTLWISLEFRVSVPLPGVCPLGHGYCGPHVVMTVSVPLPGVCPLGLFTFEAIS